MDLWPRFGRLLRCVRALCGFSAYESGLFTSLRRTGKMTTTMLETLQSVSAYPSPATCSAATQTRSSATSVTSVCHVSMTLQTGGLERLLVDFSRLYDRDAFDLHFIALDELGQPARDIAESGCAVTSIREANRSRVGQMRALIQYFRQNQINLVHTHNTYAHFYGAFAARASGVPAVVNTQHGRGCGEGWKAKMQFQMANRIAHRIVGVSDDAACLCREQDRRAADKIVTIWNGIDTERFAFRGSSRRNVAVSVARLSAEKDFPTLLRAAVDVVKEIPDFELRIVGSGKELESLQELANEYGIERHVQFLGERTDIAAILSEAGFFVSSSRTEGISLTLLEAMAVGLPVVTTRVGGNPEIVVDGQTGRLVPSENPQALAGAIVGMCRNHQAWPEMGRSGRRRVEQHFDIRNTVHKYETLYREVLGL